MNEAVVLDLARRAILIALELTMPVLVVSLVIGVLVSLFQAVTQIQEQTLSFVPKILAVVLTMVSLGPWMLHTIVGFTGALFESLPRMVR